MSAVLSVSGLRARYGAVEVLHGVDFRLDEGEIVGLVGPNGAGKTTVLRAISGTVKTSGTVTVLGTDTRRKDAAAVALLGVGHVPQGRGTFADLTVLQNLRLGLSARASRRGAWSRRGGVQARRDQDADLTRMIDTFPVLGEFLSRPAGALSGGQQQMLAVARALLARPRVLLIDEPSLGLAPVTTSTLFRTLGELRSDWGVSVLLAEQNARLSLSIADRAVVLAGGRIVHAGPAAEVAESKELRRAYLGSAAEKAVAP
jgi:branched-chain amino acid transport system ATP-binding protein